MTKKTSTPEEPAGQPGQVGVVEEDRQHGQRAQPVEARKTIAAGALAGGHVLRDGGSLGRRRERSTHFHCRHVRPAPLRVVADNDDAFRAAPPFQERGRIADLRDGPRPPRSIGETAGPATLYDRRARQPAARGSRRSGLAHRGVDVRELYPAIEPYRSGRLGGSRAGTSSTSRNAAIPTASRR